MIGTPGNDRLEGTDGPDILDGLGGYDSLFGRLGDDLYRFTVREGHARIVDTGGADVLELGSDIPRSAVRLFISRGPDNYDDDSLYVINNRYSWALGHVWLDNHLTSAQKVETLRFADGATVDLTGGLTLTGSEGSDRMGGTGFRDVVFGRGGDDELQAGRGNDTYIFHGRFGRDTILDGGGNDTVLIARDIPASSVRLFVSGGPDSYEDDSLYIINSRTGDRIWLDDHLTSAERVETLQFGGGGPAIDLTRGLTLTGTRESDRMGGTAFDDVLDGLGGFDNLNAGRGNDVYRFDGHYGWKRVADPGGHDALELGPEAPAASVRLFIAGEPGYAPGQSAPYDDDSLYLVNDGEGETIWLDNHLTATQKIESVRFSDGSTMSLAGGLTLTGAAGNDVMGGTRFADLLRGEAGDDRLDGGDGADLYYGGAGADTFHVQTGLDQVMDFNAGEGDRILVA